MPYISKACTRGLQASSGCSCFFFPYSGDDTLESVRLLWPLGALAEARTNMKSVVHIIAALTAVVMIVSCSASPDDASLSRNIVGKWQYQSPQFTATTTYSADNTFSGHVVPAGSAAFDVSGTWRIQDGTMVSVVTNSSLPEAIAVGCASTDRLISVSATQRVFHDGSRTIGETRIQ